jgi:uncharacterized membrane protein YqjE
MAFHTARSRNVAGRAGFLEAFLALCADLAGLVESRAALFVKESKKALVEIIALVVCLVAAVLFLAFGYLFLLASLVAGLARLSHLSWVWIALIVAGAHFVIALFCLLIARSRMIKRPFPELTAELKKDREWLRNLEENSRPTT